MPTSWRKWLRRYLGLGAAMASLFFCAGAGYAENPSPAEALGLAPVQTDVDFAKPTADEIKKCRVDVVGGGKTGWVVFDSQGATLRRFVDNNGDQKIDLWCYYKDGIEVYRDVDSNFDGKADQYRWLGVAGLRWGVDDDQDGDIDQWKQISAEEVSAEVVDALRTKDAARFKRVLLTKEELNSLGLDETRAGQIAERITAAEKGFAALAEKHKAMTATANWINFGATRPGVIPAGSGGSTKDIEIYDNAAAMVEAGGKNTQIAIGTLVRVGETWKVIDLPQGLGGASEIVASGFFFNAPLTPRDAAPEIENAAGLSKEAQEVLQQLEKIDAEVAATEDEKAKTKLNTQRADLQEKLITSAANKEEASMWIHQMADSIAAAVQTNGYEGGVDRLEKLFNRVDDDPKLKDFTCYVQWRLMQAKYGESIQKEGADFTKIQENWLKALEAFIQQFPGNPDSHEAYLQLATNHDLMGRDEEAVKVYSQIMEKFPQLEIAKKAAGARNRIRSVGQPIDVKGKTLDGKPVSLAELRGRNVLVHFWESGNSQCKDDIEALAQLQVKYAKDLTLVGVNLDFKKENAVAAVRELSINWPQLYEPGGMECRIATELGIVNVPTMVLIGKDGKVVNRQIYVAELSKVLSKPAATAATPNKASVTPVRKPGNK
jgi:thiol-disulfide isomerase/thioredoxin